MKFTLNWLQNYIDIQGLAPEELAEHLTMLGLEVDAFAPLYQELAELKTGLVTAATKHPDADKLTVCQVQIGEQSHQIVCGAPNVREGLAVVVALPGTLLPGNFKISKSKIRGVESCGMICSERELELSNEHDGIMELPAGTEHGQSFIKTMGLEDIFIEVDLTPNRPDCASVIGIAREIGGVVRKPLTLPVKEAVISQPSKEFAVRIEAPELCPRYAARLIQGVTIGLSPWWLRKCLLNVGLRPINNIVDITNFVMLEYGQPLHAFDFDTLTGQEIVVRNPRTSEMTFATLDDAGRQLDAEMLMICDGEKPIAVAGVMGGLNSEVTKKTCNILLESACFNAVSIRKTARKLNMATDASYRFERGVDPEGTINALNRAVDLMVALAGGTAPDNGIDCYPGKTEKPAIDVSISRTNQLLGIELTAEKIADLLESIGINCQLSAGDKLHITPPSFRVDIEREADLVEEIARLYGYDKIPATLPKVKLSYPEQDSSRQRRLALAARLTAIGYTEAINYSFISEKNAKMMNIAVDDARFTPVRLLNPLSEEQSVMRTMLLPGLLDNVKRNINHQKTSVKMFEIGKIFTPVEGNPQPREENILSGVLSGNRYGENSPLHFKQEPVDVFDAKGAVEFIFYEMGLGRIGEQEAIHFARPENDCEPFTEKEYTLYIFAGLVKLGTLGRIKTEVLRRFSIKHEVFYFDLLYDRICDLKIVGKHFSSLPVYPSVKRDIALVVRENVSSGEILAKVRGSRDKLVEHCEIFDIFQGAKIPEGHKSVALSITYRSETKTLTEKNVEKSHSKIVRLLSDEFEGNLRHA